MKYCYSTNEEDFFGTFDTEKEAIAEARESLCDEQAVHIGEQVDAFEFIKNKGKSFAEQLIENIDENLYEDVGGDDNTLSMDNATLEVFGDVILNFVKEHGDFHRWGVRNIKRIDGVEVQS